MVKNLPAIAGDAEASGSTPGLERSPEGGNGNPLRYSCLENPLDREAWWATVHGVTESQTQPSTHAHTDQSLAVMVCSAQVEGHGARELAEG